MGETVFLSKANKRKTIFPVADNIPYGVWPKTIPAIISDTGIALN